MIADLTVVITLFVPTQLFSYTGAFGIWMVNLGLEGSVMPEVWFEVRAIFQLSQHLPTCSKALADFHPIKFVPMFAASSSLGASYSTSISNQVLTLSPAANNLISWWPANTTQVRYLFTQLARHWHVYGSYSRYQVLSFDFRWGITTLVWLCFR